jgi:membrane protein implicated in regulation of membrane protease activity
MEEVLSWLADNQWSAWLALALVLGIIETTTLDLVFLMLAGGAAAGAIAALLGAPFLVAALVAIASSAALLGVVRPVAKRHLQQPLSMRTGAAALVGSKAVVLETVHAHGGLIKLAGETWTARPFDEHETIEAGKTVDVIEIKGATALVYESEAI